jgi:CRP-like cAMP-binding protein
MTYDELKNGLLSKYKKHGITEDTIKECVADGILNYDLNYEAMYNGLRMAMGSAFGEEETFTIEDVMSITEETREEVIKRIEEMRAEAIQKVENPDDYATPTGTAIYFFPNGINFNK